jgi:cob(I)alamin adenosyltransferase
MNDTVLEHIKNKINQYEELNSKKENLENKLEDIDKKIFISVDNSYIPHRFLSEKHKQQIKEVLFNVLTEEIESVKKEIEKIKTEVK